MSDAVLDVRVDGPVWHLTLDRPHALNAFDRALMAALDEAVTAFAADPGGRVAVLRGAGGRAFSVGWDVKQVAADDAAGRDAREGAGVTGFDAVGACRKPIVAAIDGWCLGGGFEVALQCDVRLATATSRFGLPEVRLGLVPGHALHALPEEIPPGEALLLLLGGEPMAAERAHQLGVVQRLVADAEALDVAVAEVATAMAAGSPAALRTVKEVVAAGRGRTPEGARAAAAPALAALDAHPDRSEGPLAFAERREPRWKS